MKSDRSQHASPMEYTRPQLGACPQCGTALLAARVQSHYGDPFVVEQCPSCRGLWFDPREHLRIHKDIVPLLDPGVSPEHGTTPSINTPLHCPKDGAELTTFRDLNVPNEIILELCPTCTGLWFNRGEYAAYRAHVATQHAQRTANDPSRTQKLAHAFLLINDIKADRERTQAAERAFRTRIPFIASGLPLCPLQTPVIPVACDPDAGSSPDYEARRPTHRPTTVC